MIKSTNIHLLWYLYIQHLPIKSFFFKCSWHKLCLILSQETMLGWAIFDILCNMIGHNRQCPMCCSNYVLVLIGNQMLPLINWGNVSAISSKVCVGTPIPECSICICVNKTKYSLSLSLFWKHFNSIGIEIQIRSNGLILLFSSIETNF